MNITIYPSSLSGTLAAPSSKSYAHRALICAAVSSVPCDILCGDTGQDVQATIRCLRALGASITKSNTGFHVEPITRRPEKALLKCGESGSTLRFLLPLAGALGVEATFLLEGRLPQRPLRPLWEEMERMGCCLSRPSENSILCTGKLQAGVYTISGEVSSQFLSGLMMALPLIPGSCLKTSGEVQSQPYVDLTTAVMAQFPTPRIAVEGDWSNAAFFLAANSLDSHVNLTGLSPASSQGDKAVAHLLDRLRKSCTISAKDIPDLIPILAVVSAAKEGAVFTDIARLRLKESDRVTAICQMLTALGGSATATENTLTVYPAAFRGGTVDPKNDHRIAMAAAIAATVATRPVTILNAECVNKSYPGFWDDFKAIGGTYEQYLR